MATAQHAPIYVSLEVWHEAEDMTVALRKMQEEGRTRKRATGRGFLGNGGLDEIALFLAPVRLGVARRTRNCRYRTTKRGRPDLCSSSRKRHPPAQQARHSMPRNGRIVFGERAQMQRVLQVTHDTRLPDGYALHEQRPDETEMCVRRSPPSRVVNAWVKSFLRLRYVSRKSENLSSLISARDLS